MSSNSTKPPTVDEFVPKSASTQVYTPSVGERPWWADQLGKSGETYAETSRGMRKLSDIGG